MDVDGTLADSGVCPISVTKNKAARATGRLSLRDNKVTKLSFEILALALGFRHEHGYLLAA
jgi:hypothetical protein